MAINFETLKTALYDWAKSVVPLTYEVIYYYPNAPRPKTPYVSLYISSFIAVNQDYVYPSTDNTGDIKIKGDRQFTLQIQAYGNNPMSVIEAMRCSLNKISVQDGLREDGIAFYQAITINDITDLVDSQFEKRAQMDVLLGIGQNYADEVGFFDEVEVEQEYLNAESQIVYTDNITITAS